MAGKFLRIGQVRLVSPKGKEEFEVMDLDNENLQEFITLLRKFGKEKVGTKTTQEIRDAQKLKREDPAHLPRVQIRRFDKKEEDYAKSCPRWILADLCVNVEDF